MHANKNIWNIPAETVRDHVSWLTDPRGHIQREKNPKIEKISVKTTTQGQECPSPCVSTLNNSLPEPLPFQSGSFSEGKDHDRYSENELVCLLGHIPRDKPLVSSKVQLSLKHWKASPIGNLHG